MKDLLVSCTIGLYSDNTLVDLLLDEEKKEIISNIILAIQPSDKTIGYINLNSLKIPKHHLNSILEKGIEASKLLAQIFSAEIKKHLREKKIFKPIEL